MILLQEKESANVIQAEQDAKPENKFSSFNEYHDFML